jgi:hypothetical protein
MSGYSRPRRSNDHSNACSKAAWNVRCLIEDCRDGELGCRTIRDPVAPGLQPQLAGTRNLRIGARCSKTDLRRGLNSVDRLEYRRFEIVESFEPFGLQIMLPKRVQQSGRFRRELDQRLGVAVRRRVACCLASRCSMLSRSRFRTGAAGTVSPAASCASLRSRAAAQSADVRRVGAVISKICASLRWKSRGGRLTKSRATFCIDI